MGRRCGSTHGEPLGGVHLDHAPQKVLAVGGDEVGHVEDPQLHLLQKVPQVVVVERQGPLGRGGEEEEGGEEMMGEARWQWRGGEAGGWG